MIYSFIKHSFGIKTHEHTPKYEKIPYYFVTNYKFMVHNAKLILLRAMTKPALMTFSNIEAMNFYFNAKLTDFAMFSYRFNVWLTYCPMYGGG